MDQNNTRGDDFRWTKLAHKGIRAEQDVFFPALIFGWIFPDDVTNLAAPRMAWCTGARGGVLQGARRGAGAWEPTHHMAQRESSTGSREASSGPTPRRRSAGLPDSTMQTFWTPCARSVKSHWTKEEFPVKIFKITAYSFRFQISRCYFENLNINNNKKTWK